MDRSDDASDETIWARVLGGASAAYGLIWDRHRARVLRHLVAIGVEPVDAEDLLAIVFLELWRKRSSVRFVDGSVLPWLIVVARNASRNAARSRIRYRALLERLPEPPSPLDPAEAFGDLDASRVQQVREVLAEARSVDRDLLALTVLEGFSVVEAARVVGMNEGAARMRLSRLRSRLRAETGPVPVEGEA